MDILPDVLAPGLRVVFCGMAAGKRSAQVKAYYAGPGNRFWGTLHAVGLTPQPLTPDKFRDLLRYGIGLTDLEKQQAGNDDELDLSRPDRSRLREQIEQLKPRTLAFVGKRAAQEYYGRKNVDYGRQLEQIGETVVFVLPSPSGAARGYWDESPWHALASFVISNDRSEQ